MHTSVPRRGIERKILTSILWVGILPLTLALVVGLIAAREGQGNAVKQTLLTAAQKTSAGVRLAYEARLRGVIKLAIDPFVIEALETDASGHPQIAGHPLVRKQFREHIEKQVATGTEEVLPSVVRLYDNEGHMVDCSRELDLWAGDQPIWSALVHEPMFLDVEFEHDTQRYWALGVAPVFDPADPVKRIGFVAEVLDANQLVRFSLGHDPGREQEEADWVYQLLFERDGEMVVSFFDTKTNPDRPQMVEWPIDPRLAEHVRRPEHSECGSLELFDYEVGGYSTHALLAYDRLFDNMNVYITVFRPAWNVFGSIWKAAAVAMGLCIVGILFLCFNAYRTVHNNIVRPVLLLNEGAQIIGQGDLELKLKIGTGDEIEELATSFNKMALDLKANIQQLGESEERYRSLVTSMRDGIFQTDPKGVIAFMNPAGVEVLGFEHLDAVLNKNLLEMITSEIDTERFGQELEEKGFIERSRVMMRRRDGRQICVELSGNVMLGDDGETEGVEGIFRDVTESVRLERAARERAERLSAISQIANVINSSLEAGRLYDSLVVEVKRLVNFDHAEIDLLSETGDAFDSRQLWPEQQTIAQRHPMDDTSCAGWVARNRECLVVDDIKEEKRPFAGQFDEGIRSCLCVPLYATGRIIGSLNLASRRTHAFDHHDVEVIEQMAPHVAVAIRNAQLLENLQASLEEVTRAREKLHDANEELKTLDEMKTNLLSNVSHELRTPLVSVMGYTDMIFNEKVGSINEVQKDYLSISLRNIEKLVTLIENLLDFSRLHRGAETLVFDSFDLVDCARSSLQIVRPVADSREIELELLAPDAEVVVEGDKGKLGQVFNNLLSNAVKFNHNGGKVSIEIRVGDDTVEASVRDTGIGIPPEALDKVFTRFYQYDSSSTRKYGGTGIGLAIAQDIVRLHGGRITVKSEEGKGSMFRFSLPLRSRKRDAEGAEEEGAPQPEGTHLLVELVTEDRALCTQVRNLLASEGMDVIHASSAFHAVSLAHRHRPDCMLVDLEDAARGKQVLDDLVQDEECRKCAIVVMTNDDGVYESCRSIVASRVRRGFRKSSLLSSIQHAMHGEVRPGEPLGKRVLCVDDDTEILTFMCRCLENEGFETDSCQSGEEALRRAVTREYSLVLLDIAMPGIDGWETCRRMKEDPLLAGIIVFMVTAKPVDPSGPRAKESGADGFLMKPFKAEDLIELVQGYLALQSHEPA